MGEQAFIIPRTLKKRRILANQLVVFFNSGGLFVLIYYLSIYFQSVLGDALLQSGVHNLPFLISGIFSVLSGFALSMTNQFIPFMAGRAAFSAVGGGLIYTFTPAIAVAKWVAYQILAGASTGFLSQIPIMANTAGVARWRVVFSAAQSACGNVLLRRIGETDPGVSATKILSVDVAELRKYFSEQQLPGIIEAYMDTLKAAFALVTALLALSVPLSLPRWEKLRQKNPKTQFWSAFVPVVSSNVHGSSPIRSFASSHLTRLCSSESSQATGLT
ncbi:hypothetical protein QQS21_009263 [Conoideocrella luteorostrata]|uniref:Uncharacterized protein n=1 Tax=Conoideocrella luteorostrata TaxID=1105319 RepID=A0AAJ0FXY9_9HYPO|nr:hypothetical protein QQS21_009263 [Conoideocrella luteorostrata]